MIVKDEEYAAGQWVGIAVLGNFSHGQQRMTGYQYLADGKFAPAVPYNLDVLESLWVLRKEMTKDDETTWHQCLIHITKPDLDIDIQFEYDDPDRWTLKTKSLDMSAYAELLRPAQSVN